MEKLEPIVIKLPSYLVAELRLQYNSTVFTPDLLFFLLQLLMEGFSISVEDQSKRKWAYTYIKKVSID